MADALSVNAVLTECNVLKNNLDSETATMLAKIGTEKRIMLSGVKHDQTNANFSHQQLEPADGILIASDLMVSAALTACNVLKNNLDRESATLLAKIGTEKRIMLSGIKHDQTEANFRLQDLKPADGIVIASDLMVSAVLKSLDVRANRLDDEAKQTLRDAVNGRDGFKLEL